jgi:hypothetical protein
MYRAEWRALKSNRDELNDFWEKGVEELDIPVKGLYLVTFKVADAPRASFFKLPVMRIPWQSWKGVTD